jgi:hypothetical protein
MTYEIDELVAMNDKEFHTAVMDDLFYTSRNQSPFQSPEVIERTFCELLEWLSITNAKIDERAEDPNCSIELYEKTVKYRAHLLSVIDITERRIGWLHGTKERTLQKWRAVLHNVIDAIMEGKDDDEILALKIPSFQGEGDTYDLETWWDIRRQKDPSRVRQKAAA